MDGYGLSEDEIFSPFLLNFTWENSNEQITAVNLHAVFLQPFSSEDAPVEVLTFLDDLDAS
ncbi:putative peroxisome proliferator-activated receptor gamma coactivator 1-alpha, partial [Triplophysa rosa]